MVQDLGSMMGNHGEAGRRQTANLSIGQYLIRRLQDYGIGHVFGIPGDYILSFYGMLEKSPIDVVGATREDCAGFAADAYARINGMGAVCVTYCVGGLSVCNSIAGAFAEKSPVVVITGSPGLNERINNPLLHHKVREFRTQLEVFEKICIAATELIDPLTAFSEIDRVLDACDRFKRPVYIEIPRDMVHAIPPVAHAFRPPATRVNVEAMEEAVKEAHERLKNAKKPVVIAGIEVHRFGLQDLVVKLVEQSNIPVAATLLGKSVINEKHPLYIGLYEGAMGRSEVTQFVEDSDCVLLLGTFMTDLNLGIYTAKLDVQRCIYVTSEQLQVSHHHYQGVPLESFLQKLIAAGPTPSARAIPSHLHPRPPEEYVLEPDAPIRISRIIHRLNKALDEQTVVIADIGDSLFAATELVVHNKTDFISPAYYTSMGFSVPASVGACVARPKARVLVIAGDGAFQMTGQELSTIVRKGFSPIVIILDNHGYGTERFLHAGDWEYNEIHAWNYHQLPAVYGGGKGYLIHTEGEFESALEQAWNDRSQMHILHVKISDKDGSETLMRMAERLGQRVERGDTNSR